VSPGGEIAYRAGMSRVVVLAFSATWLAGASIAHADDDVMAMPDAAAARGLIHDDAFTPGLKNAERHGSALGTVATSWNGAAHDTTVDLSGDVQLFGPVRLVLRVDDVFDTARPGIGAAVQWLDEARHGVSSSAYFVFKTEGFTETEGELEGLVAFGKQLGAVHGTLNLAYGQDPEGRERDGEVALALHVEPRPGLVAGVAGRYRDALGSSGDKGTGILRDALGGLTGGVAIGNFAAVATVGYGGIETVTSGSMVGGAQAGLTVGAVF
jgi:hypothetical protein